MDAYVLGAGISKSVDYPLGNELIRSITLLIEDPDSACPDQLRQEWSDACAWLSRNKNPVIQAAFKKRELEHVFTALDQVESLREDRSRSFPVAAAEGRDAGAAKADSAKLPPYFSEAAKYRDVLLRAFETYFRDRHHRDREEQQGSSWDALRRFGKRLSQNDVIVTFNYDSAMERVLLEQEKWHPADGYGFDVELSEQTNPEIQVSRPGSVVKIYHLHGAVGWYPVREPDLSTSDPEKVVSLSPKFLSDLGLDVVDPSLAKDPDGRSQALVVPSFFTNYELRGSYGPQNVLTKIWGMAARKLREADRIYIIGYSLPPADSTALMLLTTNCERRKVNIVNMDKAVASRLCRLLGGANSFPQSLKFEDWVRSRS